MGPGLWGAQIRIGSPPGGFGSNACIEPRPSTPSPGPSTCTVLPPFPRGWVPLCTPCVTCWECGAQSPGPLWPRPWLPSRAGLHGCAWHLPHPDPWALAEEHWNTPPTLVLTFLLDLPWLLMLAGFRLSAYLPADSRMLHLSLMFRESGQECDSPGQEAAGNTGASPGRRAGGKHLV